MVINHINNMEFLYISSFPDKYFEMMQKISIKSISQPSQKFNYLLTRGIKLNDEKITVLNIIDYLSLLNIDLIQIWHFLYKLTMLLKNHLLTHGHLLIQ